MTITELWMVFQHSTRTCTWVRLTMLLACLEFETLVNIHVKNSIKRAEETEATQGSGGGGQRGAESRKRALSPYLANKKKRNFKFSGRSRLAVFINLIFTCIMHRTHLVDSFETKLHNLYFVNRRPRRPATISSGSFLSPHHASRSQNLNVFAFRIWAV